MYSNLRIFDNKYFFFFTIIYFLINIHLSAVPIIKLSHSNGFKNLNEDFKYFIDESDTMDYKSILVNINNFKNTDNHFGFGIIEHPFWTVVDIENDYSAHINTNWILESSNLGQHYLDYYILDLNNNLLNFNQTGVSLPMSSRAINHKNFLIKLPFKLSNKLRILVKIKSKDTISVDMNVMSSDQIAKRDYDEQIFLGLFFGLMFAMIFYNLFIYLFVKEYSFMFYVIYLISFTILQLAISGLGQQFIWQENTWISEHINIISVGICVFSILCFLENFIDKKYQHPISSKLFNINKVLAISISLLGMTNNYYSFAVILIWLALIITFMPTTIFISIYAYFKGFKSAKYFLFGWASICAGILIYGLANFGIINFSFLAKYALQIGGSIEILVLSFALANKINVLREEKQQAQKETISQLKHNEVLLKELNNEQRRIFSSVLEAQENERIRIASDLHDNLGQILSVAKLNLSSLEDTLKLTDSEQILLLQNSMTLVDQSCSELRNVSHNMASSVLIKVGLIAAINDLVNNIKRTNKFKISFQAIDMSERLNNNIENALYPVIQELINNIIKHAEATEVSIQMMKYENALSLTIEDNGKGFNQELIYEFKGMGIKNVFSRLDFIKGKYRIESNINSGTMFSVEIPLEY